MILDDEEYKLIIENRKKFKNTEVKATMTDIEEIECALQTIIDFACAYVYEYDNEFDKREFEETTPLVKQAISELKALKENNNKGYTADDHWQQAFEYQMETIRNNPMNNIAKLQLYNQTIKECIDLLSTDGQGTKQKVKEKLEGLLK